MLITSMLSSGNSHNTTEASLSSANGWCWRMKSSKSRGSTTSWKAGCYNEEWNKNWNQTNLCKCRICLLFASFNVQNNLKAFLFITIHSPFQKEVVCKWTAVNQIISKFPLKAQCDDIEQCITSIECVRSKSDIFSTLIWWWRKI